jgi:CRP-like cAMP-binding protein
MRPAEGGGNAVPEANPSGLARLTDEQRDALVPYAARAAWPSGFTIYQRGTAADGVFAVARGRVVLRSRVRAGRSFVPAIATKNETFGSEGLQNAGHYVTDARAEDETETLFLSTSKFRSFVREQPQHAIALMSQLLGERTALLDKLRELTTLSVEQRIVATFNRFAHTDIFAGPDGRITLCPQRYRLLCELVGATRESVSLVLARLSADGFVERKGTTMLLPRLEAIMERSSHDLDLTLAPEAARTAEAVH